MLQSIDVMWPHQIRIQSLVILVFNALVDSFPGDNSAVLEEIRFEWRRYGKVSWDGSVLTYESLHAG